MMKSVVLLYLCGIVLVTGIPRRGGTVEYRIVRQVPNPADMMSMGGAGGMPGGGNPGNLAMQGLGNIPDPTALIAKGQEIASQFARGRRHTPYMKLAALQNDNF